MDEMTMMKSRVKKYLDNADEKTIKMVYAMLEVNAEENDWWDDIPDMAKRSIERGLKDIEKGKTTPHQDVMKKYKKWLS